MRIFDKLLGKGRKEGKTAEELHAFALQQTKSPEEALEYLTKALEINPKAADIWLDRGNVLDILKRYEDAMHCYDETLKVDSGNYKAWANKGNLLLKLKRYDEAIECYDKALEIDPNDKVAKEGKEAAWYNKGNNLQRLGRYKKAVKCYDKALDIKPEDNLAWANKASALGNLGKYEEAIECCNRALEINPNDKISREILEIAKSGLEDQKKPKLELPQEQRKKIYSNFVQEKDNERKTATEEVLKQVRVYGSEANAIARVMVGEGKMFEIEDKAHARALRKVAAVHGISEKQLKSIIAEFEEQEKKK